MELKSDVYEHYKKRRYWADFECICLLGGIDPTGAKIEDDIFDKYQPEDFILRRAMGHPERNNWGFLLKKKLHEFENSSYDFFNYLPFEFIEWVSKQPENFKIPGPLKIMISLDADSEVSYCWLDEIIEGRGPLISPYEYYKRIPLWDMCTCVALLDGINPLFVSGIDRNNTIAERFSKKGWELFNFVEKSAKTGELKCIDYAEKKRPEDWENLFVPSEFLSYVDSFNIPIPEPLKEIINDKAFKKNKTNRIQNIEPNAEKEQQGSDSLKAEKDNSNNSIHIDMGSSNLSEELKIALHAWNALYNSDGFNPKFGHIDNLENWIKKHYPKLSGAAKQRIAKVVNLNKLGGATSIE